MKSLIYLIIALSFLGSVFAQQKHFRQTFDENAHKWRFHRTHNGSISYESDKIVFSSKVKSNEPGIQNMLPNSMNVDFSKDFEFHTRVQTNSPVLSILMNASSDGIDSYKIEITSFDVEVFKWKDDKDKRVLKKKIKMKGFDVYSEVDVFMNNKDGNCTITIKQNDKEQEVGSFKLKAESNYSYFGFSYYSSKILTVYELSMKYYQFQPEGIEILDMEVDKEYLANVNSDKYPNLTPYVTPDGKTLFFTLGEENYDQVYYSEKDDQGNWGSPKEAPYPINIKDAQSSVISVSADMQTYFLRGTPKLGVKTDYAKVYKTDEGYSKPEPVNIYIPRISGGYTSSFMSQDGSIIISSFENVLYPKQKRDLYVFHLGDNNWFEKGINLGDVINTRDNEGTPFLAPDNRTLYFSSDGHPGYGEYDIYMSKRLDDTWTNWSKPVNLGPSINSSGWDAYFTIPADGEFGYFVSNDNENFKESIYAIRLKPEAKPEPVILITGSVIDNKTKQGVDAKVIYTNLNNREQKREIATVGGDYKAILPEATIYAIYANANGYYPISDTVDLTQLQEFNNLRKDLFLEPIQKNVAIRLNNIYFDINKYELLPLSYDELDRLLELMQSQSKMKIHIGGHTDNTGGIELNAKLSENRANAVRDYLISKGIDKSRITAKGYGQDNPLNDNSSEELRQYNRRVEFTVVD